MLNVKPLTQSAGAEVRKERDDGKRARVRGESPNGVRHLGCLELDYACRLMPIN